MHSWRKNFVIFQILLKLAAKIGKKPEILSTGLNNQGNRTTPGNRMKYTPKKQSLFL